jgi:hypothetical protein
VYTTVFYERKALEDFLYVDNAIRDGLATSTSS